jgi:spore coat polysaccharide biosynthesis protein SpsF
MVEAALLAAEIAAAQVVVFCPDSRPFVSPRMLDACARYALEAGMDYVTVGRLPAGVAPEAIPTKTLRRIALMTRASEHRSRVTEFAAAHPALFERAYLPSPPRLARPDVRLLLENDEDYRLLCRIAADVAPGTDGLLSIEDVLAYLNAESMQLRQAA